MNLKERELMEQVFSGLETLKGFIAENISEPEVRVIDTNAGKQNYLNIYRRNLERLGKGAPNSFKELKALKMLVDHIKAGEKKVEIKKQLEILNSLRGEAKFEYKLGLTSPEIKPELETVKAELALLISE